MVCYELSDGVRYVDIYIYEFVNEFMYIHSIKCPSAKVIVCDVG